jgi:hypothetical protein
MEATRARAVVWLALIWRPLVFSVIAGFVFGAIGGGIAAIVAGSPRWSGLAGGLCGYAAGVPVWMWAARSTSQKQDTGFGVASMRPAAPRLESFGGAHPTN